MTRNGRIAILCFCLVIFGIMVGSSNYEFQLDVIEAGEWVKIPTVFETAATATQYVDATQSTTYGTIASGPPSGMGVDDATTTNLTEASFAESSYTLMEGLHTFGSTPSGWTLFGCSVSGGYLLFSSTLSYKYAKTLTIDTSAYDACRIEFDWRNYAKFSMAGYTINGYVPSSLVLWTFPSYEDTTWHTNQQVTDERSAASFYFRFNSPYSTAQGYIDNVDVYARTDNTYYRFQAVFRFDSVTTTYTDYYLYVDFSVALTGSDDLDFYLEAGDTTPDNLVGNDKQDDFNVDVTSYITGSTVYVSILDDYRSGDTVSTTAYIARCYLYTSNTAPVNDIAPSCTNLDDSDNLYARYRVYNFSCSVTDANGYADLDYIELSAMDGASTIWKVRFDEDTNTFSEETNPDYIELTGSVYSKSTTNLDVWFGIRIEWEHPDGSNYDLKQYVLDMDSASDTDTYDVNYDYETRLSTDEGKLKYITEAWDSENNDWQFTDTNEYEDSDYWTVGFVGELTENHELRAESNFTNPGSYTTQKIEILFNGGIGASGGGSYPYWWIWDYVASDWDQIGDWLYGGQYKNWTFTSADSKYWSGGKVQLLHNWTLYTGADWGYMVFDYFECVYVVDSQLLSDESGTIDRGDYDTVDGITANGTISYYGFWRVRPDSNQVDIWVSCADVSGSPWSALTLSNGYFEITVDSDDIIGLDTYTFKVVSEGGGSGGTDLLDSTMTDTYIADKINFTCTTSDIWRLIGLSTLAYNYAHYEYDNSAYTGSVTWSDATNGSVSHSTAGNYSFRVISFSDTIHGITILTNITAWCIWDTIAITSGPSYYWVQYSFNAVWLIWGTPTSYVWDSNSSSVQNGIVIQSQINGTNNAWATTYGGSIAGLAIGSFGPTWWYVNISIRAQVAGLDWVIWSQVLQVDILHSIHIVDSLIFLSDDYITFGIRTNWNNATYYIWDNMTGTPVYLGGSYEGWYQVVKSSTIGLHKLIILVNGTQSTIDQTHQVATGEDSDSWEYLEFRYTVNPVVLSIINIVVTSSSIDMSFAGYASASGSYAVYENNIGVPGGTGTFSAGTISIYWLKDVDIGSYKWGIKLYDGTTVLWVNGSYYVSPPISDGLAVTGVLYSTAGATVAIYYNTNWFNTTGYLYENDVLKDSGSEATTLSYTKATVPGDYSVALKIDGGSSVLWLNYTYTIVSTPLYLTSLNIDSSGATVTAFATTSWTNATISLYQNDVLKDTDSEGTTLSYVKPTDPGDYYIALKVDGGASIMWVNQSFTVTAPTPEVFQVTASYIDTAGPVISAFASTNWGNATISLYQNDVLKDTDSEGTTLSYARPTVAGDYTVSLKIDSGSSITWLNTSLTVAIAVGDMAISYRATNGKPIPFLEVNSTLSYDGNVFVLSDNVLYGVPTGSNFTLEIRNMWGALIHNSTFTYATHKWITLNMVELVLDNQADHMVRVDLSYNTTYANITYMVPANNARILDVYTGLYLVTFTYYELHIGAGELVDYYNTTGYYVSYTVNVTGPGGLMYSGIGLLDIQNNINANVDAESETTRGFVADVKANLPSTPTLRPFISWDTMILVLFAFGAILIIVWGIRAVIRDRREGKVYHANNTDPLAEPIGYA